ncbi:MAG: hypothetical protein M0Q88_00875 [Bacilli bacterium]|nr:hypothetical protein [Bacilli bacterium]
MIVREVVHILGDIIYRNYSDKNVYIRNKTTGILYTDVNSIIDYEYEETEIPNIEETKEDISDLEKPNLEESEDEEE